MFEKLSSAFLILSRRCSSRIAGVGISCVGPIDTVTGAILNPPNFFDRACSYPIVNRMRKLANVPVYFLHDTSASVLAAKLYGTQIYVKKTSFFFLPSRGLELDSCWTGRYIPAVSAREGEIGHMSIREDGPLCTCGNRGMSGNSMPALKRCAISWKPAEPSSPIILSCKRRLSALRILLPMPIRTILWDSLLWMNTAATFPLH